MSNKDWCHKTSWSDTEKDDFFRQLDRVGSSYQRVQHLRVQARSLLYTGNRALLEPARDLLLKALEEKEAELQLAELFNDKGQCEVLLDRPREALTSFIAALDAQAKNPEWHTDAYLGFGYLVLKLGKTEHFERAEEALRIQCREESFTPQLYLRRCLEALLLKDPGKALIAAREALSLSDQLRAARDPGPPFPIPVPDAELDGRLIDLIGQGQMP